jgi:hypothetical protein
MEGRTMDPRRLVRPSTLRLVTPLAAVCCTVMLMPRLQSVEAGSQLEEEGLEIHGTVRMMGTREPVSGVIVEHFGADL